jgi:hypothetical protein
MNKYYLLIVVYAFFYLSCGSNNSEYEKLEGVRILEDEAGIIDAHIIDSIILVKYRKSEFLFALFNLKVLDKVSEFGVRGQGPREYTSAHFTNQTYYKSGKVFAGINDVFRQELRFIEVSKCLMNEPSNGSISYPYSNSLGIISDIFLVSDSMLIGSPEYKKGRLARYNLYDSLIINGPLFPQSDNLIRLPNEVRNYIYKDILRVKPDGQKVVSAMRYFNRVDLLDLHGNMLNFVEYSNANRFTKDQSTELICYFEDVYVTNNYIYLLYLNQNDDEVAEIEKNVEILVFDWNLKLINKFLVSEYLLQIAVDDNDSMLFGIDYLNDMFYLYPLTNDNNIP